MSETPPQSPTPEHLVDEAFDRAVWKGGTDALSIMQRAHARKILGFFLKMVPGLDSILVGSTEFDRIGGPRRASRLVELRLLDLLSEF